jgi:hypothetical protein
MERRSFGGAMGFLDIELMKTRLVLAVANNF